MAARGGARTGAGRRKGVPNKQTVARVSRAKASGMLPHEFLLAVSQGKTIDGHKPTYAERVDAAAKAAPYYAARLATVSHTGKDGGPIAFTDLSGLTDAQVAALEPVLSALAVQSGAPAGTSTH